MGDTAESVDLGDSNVQDTITILAGQILIGAAMSEAPDSDMGHVLAMVTDTSEGNAEMLILSAIRAVQAIITSASLDVADVGTVGGAMIDSISGSESDGN